MKIVVVGTRGIPDILGGVETHCQELYPRIVAFGHEVILMRRSCYVRPEITGKNYRGVKLLDIFAPRRKSLEAIVHTFLSVLKARSLNPDILHIHAVGPSIMTPLARLLGMKVVTTNHGHDYNREKWGRLAKAVLRKGERAAARHANGIIAISNDIASTLKKLYGRSDTFVIPNGVTPPERTTSKSYIESLGLTPQHYVLACGRFVPEKNFHQLIEAFVSSGLDKQGYKLAIAGDSDHPDEYSERLKDSARKAGVILTGFIKGEPLDELLDNAALFVLPSSHEGLPISLLEAMSHNIDVLASDIGPNKLPELLPDDFFPTGNVRAMKDAICRKIGTKSTPRTYDMGRYDWDSIASETVEAYLHVLGR